LLHLVGGLTWGRGLIVAVPAALVFSSVCLASWYPVRGLPLGRTGLSRLLLTHFSGAALSTALWLGSCWVWMQLLDRTRQFPGLAVEFARQAPILGGFGFLLYLLTVAFHHLLVTFEASREAERRALELTVLAREAELKALRAQIDPHFLFNALNSIAALTRSDPEGARTTSVRLGEFLRASMRLGREERILLEEELALTRSFLEVEKVRYGRRLRVEEDLAADARLCLVPPLLLQPLVENAVRHGIAHLLEGGVIRLRTARDRTGGDRLRIWVENERDPDARVQPGQGLGLANVGSRLSALYRGDATLQARPEATWFRVEISMPADTATPAVAAAPVGTAGS
jgi:two-component system, LytTR family, sensor histidine kinase AlgZ